MLSLLIAAVLLPTPDPERIAETIVVTAARTEEPRRQSIGAITILTRAELARLPAATLADALRFVPGFQVIPVLPGAPPMISSRGFFGAGEVEYLQLTVDGVPVADAESGLADWRSIPLDTIDRIEVLRGPGSSLFGDRAIGGVVQVFRRRENIVAIRAGSFSTREARVSASSGPDQEISVAADARRVTSDGARTHSAFNETAAGVLLKRNNVTVLIDALQRDREDPGPRSLSEMAMDRHGTSPLFAGDRENSRRLRSSIRYATSSLEASVWGGARESEIDRTLLLVPGLGDHARRMLSTTTVGASAGTARLLAPRVRLVSGGEGSRDTLESRYTAADITASGAGHRTQLAAYASAEWSVSERLRVTAGARWDDVADRFEGISISESALSPRVGVNVLAGPADAPIALFATVSRAFKAPTLDQRFDVRPLPDFEGGTFTISNTGLSSQTATTFEVGVLRDLPRVSWEAAAYWMRVDDEIDFDLATFRYANIGRSRHTGAEIGVHFLRVSAVSLRTSYIWTSVVPLSGPDRGRQLKNIAEHVARAELIADAPIGMSIAVEHAAGRFADDGNHFPLGGSTIVDLRIQRDFGRFRLAADARNLFNDGHTPLGFTLTGFDGTDTPFYYPGAPRSIDLNLIWTASARGETP